jgi:hypothetical protein
LYPNPKSRPHPLLLNLLLTGRKHPPLPSSPPTSLLLLLVFSSYRFLPSLSSPFLPSLPSLPSFFSPVPRPDPAPVLSPSPNPTAKPNFPLLHFTLLPPAKLRSAFFSCASPPLSTLLSLPRRPPVLPNPSPLSTLPALTAACMKRPPSTRLTTLSFLFVHHHLPANACLRLRRSLHRSSHYPNPEASSYSIIFPLSPNLRPYPRPSPVVLYRPSPTMSSLSLSRRHLVEQQTRPAPLPSASHVHSSP